MLQVEAPHDIVKLVNHYAKENVAKVNIYLRDPFVKRIVREEKISIITFIGSVGGLLGLFMGFSVVSLFEIIYLLALWLINKIFAGNNFEDIRSNKIKDASKTNNAKKSVGDVIDGTYATRY